MSFITKIFASMMFERPARKHNYQEFARLLDEKGKVIESRIEKGDGSGKQHSTLTHVIGIEKWAQSRIRVALGDAYKQEEYMVYRPAKETAWADLLPIFRETRAESVALAKQLAAKNVPIDTKVQHNQFDDFSTRAWLQYIMGHADFESKRIAR